MMHDHITAALSDKTAVQRRSGDYDYYTPHSDAALTMEAERRSAEMAARVTLPSVRPPSQSLPPNVNTSRSFLTDKSTGPLDMSLPSPQSPTTRTAPFDGILNQPMTIQHCLNTHREHLNELEQLELETLPTSSASLVKDEEDTAEPSVYFIGRPTSKCTQKNGPNYGTLHTKSMLRCSAADISPKKATMTTEAIIF